MDITPLTIRRHHYFHAVTVPRTAERAAVCTERFVAAGLPGARRILWGTPTPNEPPAGTAYWPRLTVPGVARMGGARVPIALEVWPWDATRAELGLRLVTGVAPSPAVGELWADLAAGVLRTMAAMLLHPASSPAVPLCAPV